MDTVPCKMNDGVCTIPDHGVTVREGRVFVRPRSEIIRDFPDLDLRAATLRPFEFAGSFEDLLTGARRLDDHVGVEDRSSGDPDEGQGGMAMMETASLHEAVAAAIADAQVTNALIVYCSPCGHHWVVDL